MSQGQLIDFQTHTYQHFEQILADWLNKSRSANTKRTYWHDLKAFFLTVYGQFEGQTISKFLKLSKGKAFEIVSRYRGIIIKQLAPATVNRRLACLKSFVSYCYQCGKCDFSLEGIKGEKSRPYRDTKGVSVECYQEIINQCDLCSPKGKRDYAILLLLWSNALRRSEVCNLVKADFDPINKRLQIRGKGRNNEPEWIEIGDRLKIAINDWLSVRSEIEPSSPLFCGLATSSRGRAITPDGLFKMVRNYARQAGVVLSPHRVRHSSITAALDATDGDVRKVQKLSRHTNLNTLLIYDDARRDDQGEVSRILENLL